MEWARVQQEYYQWIGIQRSGKRWVTALIKKLWQILWDIWDNRNDFLHKTQMAADLSGAVSLAKAIQEEC